MLNKFSLSEMMATGGRENMQSRSGRVGKDAWTPTLHLPVSAIATARLSPGVFVASLPVWDVNGYMQNVWSPA